MKKVKSAFIAMAILLSIGGAFATRSHLDCRTYPQYYWTSGGYVPAGQAGVNYICEECGACTCTFIQVGNNWQACQTGVFTPIPH